MSSRRLHDLENELLVDRCLMCARTPCRSEGRSAGGTAGGSGSASPIGRARPGQPCEAATKAAIRSHWNVAARRPCEYMAFHSRDLQTDAIRARALRQRPEGTERRRYLPRRHWAMLAGRDAA